MERVKEVKKCFDAESINLSNQEYKSYISKIFNISLNYDLKSGDASQVPEDLYQKQAEAKLVAKESGLLAGLEEVEFILNNLNYDLQINLNFEDGNFVNSGDEILSLLGPISDILSVERTLLNFLQRLCGIATLTNQYMQKIEEQNSFISATRKTIWNMWDKKAVQLGGGLSHRLNLADAAMLKENHLQILKNQKGRHTIEKSIQQIVKNANLKFIEVETTNLGEFRSIGEILGKLPNSIYKVVMFDHFSPVKIKAALSEAKSYAYYDDILFEASGNINLNTVTEYAETGIDIISSGALTQPGKSLDLSLLIE